MSNILNEVYTLARELMNKHNLAHWTFQFDRAKRRAGRCNHRRQLISLSEHYVRHNYQNLEEIKNTVLHECDHALIGPEHGHDRTWKAKALEIGAKPVRCYSSDVKMPAPMFIGICQNCGVQFPRHRRRRVFHSKCGPKKGVIVFLPANQVTVPRKQHEESIH